MNKLVLTFMSTTFIASAVFAQANTTTTATTSVAPTSGASTVTVVTPKKIKGAFAHVSSKGIKGESTAVKVDTSNSLSVTYKPEEISYGARVKAYYSLVGENQTDDKTGEVLKQSDQKATFADLKLYATKTLGTIGASDATTLKGTLYLPTSDTSKEANQYSAIGAEYFIPFTLEKGFSTQVAFFPIYSLIKGDDKFFNETYAEVRYAYTDKLSTYVGVYHDFYGSVGDTTKKSKETLAPELGLDISFPEIVDLTFAITQSRNILNPTEKNVRKSYALLAPEETSVAVQAVVQF